MRAPGVVAVAFVATLLPVGCVPSRSSLFDPIARSVQDRVGVRPEWRSGWSRSPAVESRIRELLAKPLAADAAAVIAVLNSSEIQSAYAELGVVAASVASARTVSNPQLSAELRLPLDSGGEQQLELAAVQSVSDLLAILPRVRAADANLKAARRRAVVVTIDVAARARAAVHEAIAATQRLAMRRLIAETAAASAELARALHEAGNITDLDFTREAVFAEEAQLQVRSAEAEVVTARERANAILGLSGSETAWTASATLPDAPEQLAAQGDLEREAVASSLDLDALRWSLEAAGQEVGLARMKSFLPDLGLGVGAEREGAFLGVGPIATLSIPLFDWGSGERAAAWARVRRLQHRYTGVALDMRAATRAARARLVATHQRAVRMRTTVLPLRERLVDESFRQFNAMNVSTFELITSRREHIEAEERYIDALRDYWVAQTEVDQLRAGSLPGAWRGDGGTFRSEQEEQGR